MAAACPLDRRDSGTDFTQQRLGLRSRSGQPSLKLGVADVDTVADLVEGVVEERELVGRERERRASSGRRFEIHAQLRPVKKPVPT